MSKFRKKSVVIDAVQIPVVPADTPLQWPWCEWLALAFATGEARTKRVGFHPHWHVEVLTLEGKMLGLPGDWIIRGVDGEIYLCKEDLFARTFEAIVE